MPGIFFSSYVTEVSFSSLLSCTRLPDFIFQLTSVFPISLKRLRLKSCKNMYRKIEFCTYKYPQYLINLRCEIWDFFLNAHKILCSHLFILLYEYRKREITLTWCNKDACVYAFKKLRNKFVLEEYYTVYILYAAKPILR